MLRTRWVSGLGAALAALLLTAGTALARPLSVEVWTDRGDDAVYTPGEVMQVKARTNDDAFLLVYEIDSEGRVTVLFPFRRAAGMIEGRTTLRLPPPDSRYELTVESETGQGYLVAIASRQPFRELPWYLRPFDPQGESVGYEGRHDEEEGFDEDGRVLGDPTVAIERIRRAVLGADADYDDFATSYATYYVGHQVRYPRYICYDCHRPGMWGWWDGFDPYWATCSVIDFRVNWNWCWGPCMWSGHVPYYYYVVRSDCPPRYRYWYDRHDRWSSWDGYRRWNDLWGGSLTRRRSDPPVGYIPPPPKGGDNPRSTPPGWIKSPTRTTGGGGVPIGRNRPGYGDRQDRTGPVWRVPTASSPPRPSRPEGVDKGDRGGSNDRPSGGDRPRYEPTQPVKPDRDGTRYVPREQPGREPVRRETPNVEPPRRESPRQDPPRAQPRQDSPRQDPPHAQPRQDSPRHDPPKPAQGEQGEKKGRGGR